MTLGGQAHLAGGHTYLYMPALYMHCIHVQAQAHTFFLSFLPSFVLSFFLSFSLSHYMYIYIIIYLHMPITSAHTYSHVHTFTLSQIHCIHQHQGAGALEAVGSSGGGGSCKPRLFFSLQPGRSTTTCCMYTYIIIYIHVYLHRHMEIRNPSTIPARSNVRVAANMIQ